MNKRVKVILLAFMGMMIVSGCSYVATINLTDQEQQQVVGYATDLLLKYDSNHQNLVDTSEARLLKAKVEAFKASEAEQEEDNNQDESNKTGVSENQVVADGTQDIAEALGLNGFEIKYDSFEMTDSYPKGEDANSYFSMSATPGNHLMVIHFKVKNVTDGDLQCNTLSVNPTFRILLNETDRKNALTTLLLNDLSTLDEMITANGELDTVVVLEVPMEYGEINQMHFIIKNGENQSTIPLK
ncbi:MAG: hypothetical protein PHY47_23810 [Lachnospiraceae bacterium]|nr:hypothetical protein [Lachnospiraceae bacterium]